MMFGGRKEIMKIKDGFMLREVAGSYVVVPMGKEAANFNGMITLNEMGAFLWKHLEKDSTREELLAAVLEEYDVTEERALAGIDRFLEKITEEEFVEN